MVWISFLHRVVNEQNTYVLIHVCRYIRTYTTEHQMQKIVAIVFGLTMTPYSIGTNQHTKLLSPLFSSQLLATWGTDVGTNKTYNKLGLDHNWSHGYFCDMLIEKPV